MRTPCKYEHEVTYKRWVNGSLVDVTVDECWGEKEPTVCDIRRMEICGKYNPLSNNLELSWIPTNCYDGWSGPSYKCARCGHKSIGKCNYCYNCGYEYAPWDGKIL